MKKKLKIDRPSVKNCGGKRGKGCGSNWAGATESKPKIKMAA